VGVAPAAPPVEAWERRPGAALAPLPWGARYRRREPEATWSTGWSALGVARSSSCSRPTRSWRGSPPWCRRRGPMPCGTTASSRRHRPVPCVHAWRNPRAPAAAAWARRAKDPRPLGRLAQEGLCRRR